MNNEEKKAINNLNFIIVTDIYDNEVSIDKTKVINEYNESVGIVLNLIQKQEKAIDKMTEELYFDGFDRICQECYKECERDVDTLKYCIKKYFIKENKNE